MVTIEARYGGVNFRQMCGRFIALWCYLFALPLAISYFVIFLFWLAPPMGKFFVHTFLQSFESLAMLIGRVFSSYFSIINLPGINSVLNYFLTILFTVVLLRAMLVGWSFFRKKMTLPKLYEDTFISLGILLAGYVLSLLISLIIGVILGLGSAVLSATDESLSATDESSIIWGLVVAVLFVVTVAVLIAQKAVLNKKVHNEAEQDCDRAEPDEVAIFLNASRRKKKQKLKEVLASAEAGQNIDAHLKMLYKVANELPRSEPFWRSFCKTLLKIEILSTLNRN